MLRGVAIAGLASLGVLVPYGCETAGPGPAAKAAAAPSTFSLHPANRHYFRFRGRRTVLVGDGIYGAVVHRDFDFGPYLDELASHGLNQVRLFSGSFVGRTPPYDGYEDSLVPGERLIVPWARSSEPGYTLGGNKFDLSRWDDEYFERLQSFVAAAGARGIVVEVVLFSANYGDREWSASPLNGQNNVNGVGNVHEYDAFGDLGLLPYQEALVRKLARELNGYDNVYFEILNEPHHAACPAGIEACAPPAEWEQHMVNVFHDEERGLARKHLVARGVTSPVNAAQPGVAVYNFHYASSDAARANYRLRRPLADDETGFKGTADAAYRSEAWEFLLAGGAGFSNLDWSFTPSHERGDYRLPSNFPAGGGSESLRRQLGILARFLRGFNVVTMGPARTVVRSVEPNAHVEVLAQRGRQYAIYVRGDGRTRLVVALPAGGYRATWLIPRTGARSKAIRLRHPGGPVTLVTPRYVEDVALSITR